MNTSSSYFGNGYWWLRSPIFIYSDYARSVDYDGFAGIDYNVYDFSTGVVPALWITL